jgi:predicted nucleotidyltransferase
VSSVTADFLGILRTLTDQGAEFIVVGGVGAVLHGALITTLDLDLVHARDPDNIARLLTALSELDARYRQTFGRDIRPDRSHLESPGHQLLETRLGALDLLGTLDGGRGYEELLGQTMEMEVGGRKLKVLTLEELIAVKRRAGRDKDKLVVPILEHTLRERDRRKGT